MKKILIIILTVLMLLWTIKAATATDINNCYNITVSGVYTLNTSIIDYDNGGVSGSCMHIKTGDVLLDCQGNTIDGLYHTGNFHGINISAVNNVTINNCKVSNFVFGVISQNVSNVSMNNNNVSNVHTAIFFNSIDGFYADNVSVTNNSFFLGDGSDTIKNVIIKNSSVNCLGDADDGFTINTPAATNISLSNINITRCPQNPTLIYAVNGLTINGMILNSNDALDQLYIDTCSNVMVNNVSLICDLPYAGNTYAFYLASNTNLTITNSSVRGCNYSFDYQSGEINAYNNFLNTTYYPSFAADNINVWNTTLSAGTRIFGDGVNVGGNFWALTNGTGYSQTCTDANADGICDVAFDLFAQASCTQDVNCGNNTDYLPLSTGYVPAPANRSGISNVYLTNHSIALFGDTSSSAVVDNGMVYYIRAGTDLNYSFHKINITSAYDELMVSKIDSKWSSLSCSGCTESPVNITNFAYDKTDKKIYFTTNNGNVGYYNLIENTIVNLTDHLPYKQTEANIGGYISIDYDNKNKILYLGSNCTAAETCKFLRINLADNSSGNLTGKYGVGRIRKIIVDNITDLVYLYDDKIGTTGGIVVFNHTSNTTISTLTNPPFNNIMLSGVFTGNIDLLNNDLIFRAKNDTNNGVFSYDPVSNTTTYINTGSNITGYETGLRVLETEGLIYLTGNYSEGIGVINISTGTLTELTVDKTAPLLSGMFLESVTGYSTRTYYVYANCTDTGSSIAANYPKVSFNNPNGGSTLGNYTMSHHTGSQYRYPVLFSTVGEYANFTFYCRDTQNNLIINDINYLLFMLLGGGSSAGGGGGGNIIKEELVLQNITLQPFCGDGICDSNENSLSCSQDCSINIEDSITCLFKDPASCFKKESWFITVMFIIIVVSALSFFIGGGTKGALKKWF